MLRIFQWSRIDIVSQAIAGNGVLRDHLIYFIRHGETDWNAEMRFQGQRDIPINDRGRGQADGNGRKLAAMISDPGEFDFVASPLSRTRETMERARAAMGLPSDGYSTDRRLMEVNYGDWEGKTLDEITQKFPDLMKDRRGGKWRFLPPGKTAESYAILADRVMDWLHEVSQPTVCVTHGGVIRSIFHKIGGLSEEEAGEIRIHQDRIVEMKDGNVTWK